MIKDNRLFRNPFVCKRCGSKRLKYRKYILCESDVEYQDGVLCYLNEEYDTNDFLPVERGYVCRKCGHPVVHCGKWIDNEKDLIAYLIMDPSIRDEEQYSYDVHQEMVADQEIERQQENYEIADIRQAS